MTPAPHEPIYTMEDADGAIRRIIPCRYGQEVELCEGIKIRFTDVGHLLGSASIEIDPRPHHLHGFSVKAGKLIFMEYAGGFHRKGAVNINRKILMWGIRR